MSTHAIADTSALLGRSLRHITRSMDTIITTTVMPIAFLLLFVYVFGGAIATAHSGRVGIESVPGTGSRIGMVLPVRGTEER